MSTQILNFKKLEVVGATKEEALANAPFEIMGDATQAYKLWTKKQDGAITEDMKKQFMINYLKNHSKNIAGVGFSITVEPAVADTRQRPYTFHDVSNKEGARAWKQVYDIYENKGTVEKPIKGKYLGQADTTKTVSKNVGKELYTMDGFKGNMVCYVAKKCVKGEPIAWTAEYTPSKSAKVGTYIVFGIER